MYNKIFGKIGLHIILQIQIEKIQNCLISMCKIILNENPWSALKFEIEFCL